MPDTSDSPIAWVVVDPEKVTRELVKRDVSLSTIRREAGLARATIAKIARREPVRVVTARKLWATLREHPVIEGGGILADEPTQPAA